MGRTRLRSYAPPQLLVCAPAGGGYFGTADGAPRHPDDLARANTNRSGVYQYAGEIPGNGNVHVCAKPSDWCVTGVPPPIPAAAGGVVRP
ncbi:hypothetical protein Sxan_26710 [Streptomyces xanthophaeus]|uniref:Uncharacterized protein n=1 Tax=Streptomyces xanthophaeus TaxID=67385 RepID=A0A919LF04_9ACTN|nr:hypothetical protein Sxan_26710 [Streptomyces xanthophaeus]